MFSFFFIEPRMILGAASILIGCYFLRICAEDVRTLLAYRNVRKSPQRAKPLDKFDDFYKAYVKCSPKHDVDLPVSVSH